MRIDRGNSLVPRGMSGALSPTLVALARAVSTDRGFGDDLEVKPNGDVLEVHRKDVLVVVTPVEALENDALAPYLERVAEGSCGILLIGKPPDGLLERFPLTAVVGLVEGREHADTLYLALLGLLERVDLKQNAERRGRWMNRYRYELGELIETARALTRERNLDRLLGLILEKSRFITGADAGSIYVLEGLSPDPRQRRLRFKLSQNDSIAFESAEFTIPVSMGSIAGAAVLTRAAINLPDVYELDANAPYQFDRSFDEKNGYRTRSVIAMPMISAEEEVIGVIQLINKKSEPKSRLASREDVDAVVVPFDARSEELLATLSAQAGIALENALLYDEIRRIFEGFVRASVQAIEQRDPTTSGHSLRVSVLSTALAQAVDRESTGAYRSVSFSRKDLQELEYAALLHDFGKIGVREQVLVKSKKLYPHVLEAVRARVDFIQQQARAEIFARKIDVVQRGGGGSDLDALDRELAARTEELEAAWRVVAQANEPTVLQEGEFSRIAEIGALRFIDARGEERTLLSADEVLSLQVQKGSLNGDELDEIRSHVVHTYNFLAKIPWGKSFSRVPMIAGSHHERLDGTGYPNRLRSDAIPVPSKIMTIADIFDALTARDRPYKRALPVDRALDILGFEVKENHVDAELVRIFREAEVFRVVERDLAY